MSNDVTVVPPNVVQQITNAFPFDETREGQPEIIWRCLQSYATNKQFIVLDAGTGVGKSPIGVTAASMISNHLNSVRDVSDAEMSGGVPSVLSPTVITKTRILQKQYEDSFEHAPNLEIGLLWGKAHYSDLPVPCPDSQTIHTCSGSCPGMTFVHAREQCPYTIAKENYASPRTVGVTNNSMFLVSEFFRAPVNVLVVDECHNLVQDLIDMSELTLASQRILNIMIEYGLPNQEYVRQCVEYERNKFREGRLVVKMLVKHIDTLIGFTTAQLIPPIGEQIEVLRNSNPVLTNRIRKMIDRLEKILQYFRDLEMKRKMLVNSEPSEWVSWREEHDTWGHVIKFKPFEPLKYVVDMLLNSIDFTIFMSATPGQYSEFCRYMHLDPAAGSHVYAPTTFPVENRQVQALNIANMSWKNRADLLATDGSFTMTVRTLLNKHKDERGIIHSVSYANAELLKESLGKDGDRLVIPERGIMLNREYIESYPSDVVFISPSITEGVSFDDDLARFQIIMKIPFGNLGDVWTKAKLERDQDWYNNEAALVVQQMVGRIVRGPEDYGTTYVLDSNFDRVKGYMPPWFTEALVEI